MVVHGKAYGKWLPTAFPLTLEIETADFHIPSAPTTVKLTQIKDRKEPPPAGLPDFLHPHPSVGKDWSASLYE
jgi:hypothetical protein